LAALQERNTTLLRIVDRCYGRLPDRERIDSLLALNRYAADFPQNARSVPMKLWGDVLCRVSTDACNSFVLDLVHRAVRGRPAESRIRGGQGGKKRSLKQRKITDYFSCPSLQQQKQRKITDYFSRR
jgi:hypothetical protein